MSTNKTTNYQLHSWVPGDDFLRQEFNENFAKLDDSVRFVFGTYKGSVDYQNSTPQRIELGLKPKAVFVSTSVGAGSRSMNGCAMAGFAGPDSPVTGALTLDDSGFTVANRFDKTYFNYTVYDYYFIALY